MILSASGCVLGVARYAPTSSSRGPATPASPAGLAIFLILLIGLCSGLRAQSAASVTGKVSDPSSASIAGASVWLHARDGSLKRATITNEEGTYRFDSVPRGDYLVEVETRDFARTAVGPIILSGDAPRQVDIQLELARVREEVTVTTSGTPLRVEEISKALDTVDWRQMERRAEYSIPEALRNIPGLRVQQQQGPGSLTTIQIRG